MLDYVSYYNDNLLISHYDVYLKRKYENITNNPRTAAKIRRRRLYVSIALIYEAV